MHNPKVSIVIPVYNVENYLEKCLNSVLAQDYPNIEIVCVNDGSTDDSYRILKRYEKDDTRVVVVNQENSGVSLARNNALKIISGDFVMFVDSDDWLDQNVVSSCVNHMSDENADIVMFPYVSEHKNVKEIRKIFNSTTIFTNDELVKLARLIIGPIGHEIVNPANLDRLGTLWAKMYRRSVLNGMSFVDLKEIGTAEDSLYNMMVFKNARKVIYISEDFFYHYRKTNTSSVTKKYKDNLGFLWSNQYKLIKKICTTDDEICALNNRIALNLLGRSVNNMSVPEGFFKAYSLIAEDLKDPMLHEAISQLDISYLPIHWKCFFGCAKNNFVFGVFSLSWLIHKALN